MKRSDIETQRQMDCEKMLTLKNCRSELTPSECAFCGMMSL